MAPVATAVAQLPGASSLKTTPKSVTRRPTLVRKWDDAGLDSDGDRVPSSPSKRARVSFKDEVEVKVVDEWGKPPELIREEVRRALERHAHGDSVEYQHLVSIYSVDTESSDIPSPTAMKHYTVALIANTASLKRPYSELVQAMLKGDWIWRDDGYFSLFLRFIRNLLSAQSTWLRDTLRTLVQMFESVPKKSFAVSDRTVISPAKVRKRVHSALKSLLRLIPSSSNVLATILSNTFPHASNSVQSHVRYVRSILRVTEYAPELRPSILALITDRLVKIDVQVQINLEDLDDEVGDGLVQDIPQPKSSLNDESEEEEESDEESDMDDEDLDPEAQRAKEIAANVEKLDIVLDILFEYYTTLFDNPDTQDSAIEALISHFTNVVLPTYRSRHTQFLLFHFAQSQPFLIDVFIGILTKNAFDRTPAAIIRQSSAAYLASFISRGVHVPTNIVRDVFEYLGDLLSELRAEHTPTCRGPDARRYSTYYALMQALIYIFCFRWPDLVVSPDDDISPSPLALHRDDDDSSGVTPTFLPGIKDILFNNIFSPLNPLRVCAPSIVSEFARIARHSGVVYVYHLLETNKRVRLVHYVPMDQRETALSGKKDEDWQRLDAYFPFDPYKLPKSKRWIEKDYREWCDVPQLPEDGEEADESSEEDDDALREEDEETGTGEEDD